MSLPGASTSVKPTSAASSPPDCDALFKRLIALQRAAQLAARGGQRPLAEQLQPCISYALALEEETDRCDHRLASLPAVRTEAHQRLRALREVQPRFLAALASSSASASAGGSAAAEEQLELLAAQRDVTGPRGQAQSAQMIDALAWPSRVQLQWRLWISRD